MRTSTKLRIAFDDIGDDIGEDIGDHEPALLFLPGWCGDRTAFRDLLPLAARHRRALAIDWRGHGASERPDDDFGTDDLVEDALNVLEQACVDVVIPVGASHAGWVAIELRRRLGPDRVPAIILLDWMVLGPPPPFLDALVALQDADAWHGVRAGLFSMWTTGVDVRAVHEYVADMASYGFDSWARAGREIAARFAAEGSPVAAIERLGRPCPTLHVYAQPPDEGFYDAQRAFAAAHPWFSVFRLDAHSHFPMIEVPADLANALEAFISALPSRPGWHDGGSR